MLRGDVPDRDRVRYEPRVWRGYRVAARPMAAGPRRAGDVTASGPACLAPLGPDAFACPTATHRVTTPSRVKPRAAKCDTPNAHRLRVGH